MRSETERRLPDARHSKTRVELLESVPALGYLTISNALQWRLQYTRVIDKAGEVDGIHRVWRGEEA
jgi:hypothetical protein